MYLQGAIWIHRENFQSLWKKVDRYKGIQRNTYKVKGNLHQNCMKSTVLRTFVPQTFVPQTFVPKTFASPTFAPRQFFPWPKGHANFWLGQFTVTTDSKGIFVIIVVKKFAVYYT